MAQPPNRYTLSWVLPPRVCSCSSSAPDQVQTFHPRLAALPHTPCCGGCPEGTARACLGEGVELGIGGEVLHLLTVLHRRGRGGIRDQEGHGVRGVRSCCRGV